MCVKTKKRNAGLLGKLVDVVELLGFDEKHPADDVARKLYEVLEESWVEADLPDEDSLVKWDDEENLKRDWNLVDTGDLEDYLRVDEIEEKMEEGGYVTHVDLEDLARLSQVRAEVNLVRELSRGGILRRLKWLLTGR